MSDHQRFLAAFAASLLLLIPVAGSAGDFGGSGEIDGTSSVDRTINVGEYTLHVVSTSTMLDEGGRRLSFAQLADIDGNVGFTMRKVGARWQLIRLVVEELEDDAD